ncbi:MAG TPA: hypothetical protein VE136_13220 [Anaerolineales bacterium]|nr:hypothetical protein [Anaerolineales bacterium]
MFALPVRPGGVEGSQFLAQGAQRGVDNRVTQRGALRFKGQYRLF